MLLAHLPSNGLDVLQEEFGELLWPDKIMAARLQSLQVLRRAVPTEASTGRGRRPEEALVAILAATRLAARFGETADGTIQTLAERVSESRLMKQHNPWRRPAQGRDD